MSQLPHGYSPITSSSPENTSLDFWQTSQLQDAIWDDFLLATPTGQYEQSSLWAEFKNAAGWQCHRVVAASASHIVGGFQLLWKNKGPFRLGYIHKGPVFQSETPLLLGEMIRLLRLTARTLRLNVLCLQQPHDTSITIDPFIEANFIASNPLQMLEATCHIDLHQDMETLRSKMSSSLRGNLRTAKKLPVQVRNGGPSDIALFFSLMAQTCERQKTAPNPSSELAVRQLWDAFSPKGMIRLTLAECEGQVPAALLTIGFGNRLTAFKKGWSGDQKQWHPNELLQEESIEWARGMGYKVYDFYSFTRESAERIIAGEPVKNLKLSFRDEYHRRFGCNPRLLPRALVFIPNPLFRFFYRNAFLPYEQRKKQKRAMAQT
jgi:lipid II:glycine glycyltransferase (peptidoglycan interpeptide bridge formation enzyme)